jgi:transaldolase
MKHLHARKPAFSGQIKIFLDSSDRATMVEMAGNPLVKGFTTNPSLMRKAGVQDYKTFCQEILTQVKGKPISFEVFADEFPEMKRQALEIRSWDRDRNIYVKIPVCNSKGESSAPLIRELSQQGVALNITALYTLPQIQKVCEAVKGGAPSLISVFAGRIADTGRDPMPLMLAALETCLAAGPSVELLWASTREAFNIVQADQMGCHVITAPVDMIKRVAGFGRELDEVTLDTVRTFKTDAEAAKFRL